MILNILYGDPTLTDFQVRYLQTRSLVSRSNASVLAAVLI